MTKELLGSSQVDGLPVDRGKSPMTKEPSGSSSDPVNEWTGQRRSRWETEAVTEDEIARLQQLFTDSIVFTDKEVAGASKKWSNSLIGKLLGKGVQLDFLSKELKLRWGGLGDFKVVPLSIGHQVFQFNSEDCRDWVLANGPWIIAGQILALEHWRLNFSVGTDTVNSATLWMRLPDLPMEMWERSMLLRVASTVRVPKFVDNCTEEAVGGGYAKACVQVDLSRPLRPGVEIVASGKHRWQQFKYENVPCLYFLCGRVGHFEDDYSQVDPEEARRRKESGDWMYGPWMVVSRVPLAGSSVRTGKE
uniref:Uncharacterized protein LOC105061108 n=1 Tax=Elaeis guineensis var. tenera TaxID=51953 RepID=A0A6I9SGJ3_ELAGV|nr:uncharacterized protein LOC105061108 [Elaeis guineensis]